MTSRSCCVACPENEHLVQALLLKLDECDPKDQLSHAIKKATKSLCEEKQAVKTRLDFLKIKFCGQSLYNVVKSHLQESESECGNAERISKQRSNEYVPQENSAAYAILIILFRAKESGTEFLKKEEIIEKVEISGLCRTTLRSTFQSNSHYCGWSSMGVLVRRNLIIKWSNPCKYMLTELGFETARTCMVQSGIIPKDNHYIWSPPTVNSTNKEAPAGRKGKRKGGNEGEIEEGIGIKESTTEKGSSTVNHEAKKLRSPNESPDSLTSANLSSSGTFPSNSPKFSPEEDEDLVILEGNPSVFVPRNFPEKSSSSRSFSETFERPQSTLGGEKDHFLRPHSERLVSTLASKSQLPLPPLVPGKRFSDLYQIVLYLDNREVFVRGKKGASSVNNAVESLNQVYGVSAFLRNLPVGDALWLARRKSDCSNNKTNSEGESQISNNDCGNDFVLDFILERKRVDDLWNSILGKRFKDQKLRLLRCGLKKVIYLIEGDIDNHPKAQHLKTGALQTQIEEKFDIQRTRHWEGDDGTIERYAFLTEAIRERYEVEWEEALKGGKEFIQTPSFDDFKRRCKVMVEQTVGDIFGAMLSQISHVTEPVALAIMVKYPTLASLVDTYRNLEYNPTAQETLLMGIKVGDKFISEKLSKRIFQVLWGA